MAGTVYSGAYTSGIVLDNPATQRPVTVTGTITDAADDAVYGEPIFAWTVANRGTIDSTGSVGSYGIHLAAGGTLSNAAIGVGPASRGLIEGYGGVLIEGAAGFVTNLGTILGIGANTNGVLLTAGGRIANGSAADTTALISDARHGIDIAGGTGVVTNFGTIKNVANHSNVVLSTGTVINGSSTSTAALITGSGAGIYITDGIGTVVNFATIESSSAVALHHGGRVTNGAAGSTAAQIVGTASNGVFITGAAGIVANFGTIESASLSPAIEVLAGGSITNGSAAASSALIDNTTSGAAIYLRNLPGTVTNFGTIENSGTTGSSALIWLAAGGTVTNAKGGVISSAGAEAISASGAPATVTNFGTIENTGSSGSGVNLTAGGALTNGESGVIAAGGFNAIFASASLATVTNLGTIENSGTYGGGVRLDGGGTVTNGQTGSSVGLIEGGAFVSGGAGAITNYGTITGTSGAAGLDAGGTITNFGTIKSTGSLGEAVELSSGGAVINDKGGVITGAGFDAISASGAPATVTNFATIQASGAAGTAIFFQRGGKITNGASGSSIGLIEGGSVGVQVDAGIVTNFGTITGAVGFIGDSSGSNTLVNYGTVASTAGAAGVAVEMNDAIAGNLVIVEPGAVFKGSVLGGGRGEIDFVGAGVANMTGVSGFETIRLGNGVAHSLILADANFTLVAPGSITVIGGNAGNTVDASAVTITTFPLARLIAYGGAGKDVFSGSAGNDTFIFTDANLAATDTVNGRGGTRNELDVTTSGTVHANGVSAVEIYQLANGGADTLSLADGNFAGVLGGHISVYGGTGGNTIDGSALSKAGENLVVYGGSGADVLKGGAGNDVFVFSASALTAADTVNGGGGKNGLLLTSAGAIAANGVSAVETYVLADGGANTLTLASGNFTGAGGTITVSDGNGGNTVALAAGLPAADRLIAYAGGGLDKLTGGAGNDVFYAGGDTVMTGKTGTNEFIFSGIGSNTITDFTASTTNEIVFSNSGFGLGLSGGSATPKPLPANLFVADAAGTFTKTSERFAYGTATGKLYYSAAGSTASEHLVATLTGTPTPALAASHLFFIS